MVLACLLLAAAGSLLSCSSTETYPGLSEKGMLPLSDDDSFFGSNLFLSREMEKSSHLFNFVKTHGSPTAIEITHKGADPTKLIMYFARTKEVYVAVPDNRMLLHEWTIRGPYQIEWRDNREVHRVQTAFRAEPPFYLWGNQQRFPVFIETKSREVILPVIPPPPAPTPKPKAAGGKKSGKSAAPNTTPSPEATPFRALNTDQQALMMAQGYAERADNGDLIHTTKLENETPEKIAKWYTGAEKNAGEIAKLNSIPDNQPCAKGARIRIPLAMLKQFKVMPDSFQ